MKFKCIFQLLSHKKNSSLILFTSQSKRGRVNYSKRYQARKYIIIICIQWNYHPPPIIWKSWTLNSYIQCFSNISLIKTTTTFSFHALTNELGGWGHSIRLLQHVHVSHVQKTIRVSMQIIVMNSMSVLKNWFLNRVLVPALTIE